ncbi:MAG: ABC transporter ATP-binding protein [Deltaproteobacteria bacterium]|nr:MAG: ABC transporter ATP-binding protein [Deltaproteobacteria bacterium]PIE72651.1 MAG: ABC transporter ATP-binding protein [Deltaproteobacteria bacterium]
MNQPPILKIDNLGHSYGSYMVIRDISIEVAPGELSALIGPNGAGKTTFYNSVSGHFRPTNGTVYFDGRDITGLPAHKLVPRGLLRSFQITNIFPNLSVIENVLVPLVLHYRKGYSFWGALTSNKKLYQKAEEVLDKVGILDAALRPASQLPYGDKRLVEMAIVLARNPKLVMLDEPTAGMNPEETDRMIHLIKDLATRFGTTFFLTEHDMKVVFSVASKIYVLHQGVLLAEGDKQTIQSDPKVREAYLGGAAHD